MFKVDEMVAVWPDGFLCYLSEVDDYTDRSDDYEVLHFMELDEDQMDELE